MTAGGTVSVADEMELDFDLPASIDAAPLARAQLMALGSVLSVAVHDAIVTRWGVAKGSTHVWFEIVRP